MKTQLGQSQEKIVTMKKEMTMTKEPTKKELRKIKRTWLTCGLSSVKQNVTQCLKEKIKIGRTFQIWGEKLTNLRSSQSSKHKPKEPVLRYIIKLPTPWISHRPIQGAISSIPNLIEKKVTRERILTAIQENNSHILKSSISFPSVTAQIQTKTFFVNYLRIKEEIIK